MGEPRASALLQELVHCASPAQRLVNIFPSPCPSLPWKLWRRQLTACHPCRRDYIDPSHVKDGGVTPDDTRKWKVLQELQVSIPLLLGAQRIMASCQNTPQGRLLPRAAVSKSICHLC